MTLNEFVDVIRGLFAEGTVVGPNVRFRELDEWSSMQALILIAAVDEHFGVTLPEKEFRKTVTIEDLFLLTISLKKNV